ncbi:MAG: DUF4384 domain-containing protein [Cyanothece sp. SIO1E1]|nr:DUF4384 domain-containing protein [Cyanothece sp. SIO1E1]
MKRRHLLQFAASTLTVLGSNALYLQQRGIRYARVLAQPTRRKRALLVGINDYPKQSIFTDLKGCVTDVDLQRELLIHRFGFCDADIEVLTNEKASRSNILNAFEECLIKPCQEGDVVVFHFSGHGRRVIDPVPVRTLIGDTDPRFNSTLVPADDFPIREDRRVSDIMGKTLFLLTSAIKTSNVTIVLDTCYAGGGVRGNARVRSPGDIFDLRASQEELDYQQDLLSKLDIDGDQFAKLRDIGIAKGIVIAAAQGNQKAVDASFDQFYAGAFTYFLTQFLWHEAESIESVIANTTLNLQKNNFKQYPLGCVAPAQCNFSQTRSQPQPIYFVDPREIDNVPAEAVLLSNQGSDRALIWLGGSNAHSIVAYGKDAEFSLAGQAGQDDPRIKVLSRSGLIAEVRLPHPLPRGTRFQEAARVVPRNVTLRIGLDPSLQREAITAQQSFEDLRLGNHFELILAQDNGAYPDGEIHYILSRITDRYREFLRNSVDNDALDQEDLKLPESDSIVLFSPGIDSLVPGTTHHRDSLISDVIINLKATFRSLYAARFLKLAINSDASQVTENDPSRLNIDIHLRTLEDESHDPSNDQESRHSDVQLSKLSNLLEIPLGTDFKFVITNHEPEALHVSILEIDEAGEIKPLLPNQYTGSIDETIIPARTTKIIPTPDSGVKSFYIKTKIRAEFLFMVSRKSPKQALVALRNNDERSAKLFFADALLADISGVKIDERGTIAQRLNISTTDLTAFSIPFRVI